MTQTDPHLQQLFFPCPHLNTPSVWLWENHLLSVTVGHSDYLRLDRRSGQAALLSAPSDLDTLPDAQDTATWMPCDLQPQALGEWPPVLAVQSTNHVTPVWPSGKEGELRLSSEDGLAVYLLGDHDGFGLGRPKMLLSISLGLQRRASTVSASFSPSLLPVILRGLRGEGDCTVQGEIGVALTVSHHLLQPGEHRVPLNLTPSRERRMLRVACDTALPPSPDRPVPAAHQTRPS